MRSHVCSDMVALTDTEVFQCELWTFSLKALQQFCGSVFVFYGNFICNSLRYFIALFLICQFWSGKTCIENTGIN